MDAIYQEHRVSVEDMLGHFAPAAGQVGALMAVDGEIVGVDFLHQPAMWERVWRKILAGAAIDALGVRKELEPKLVPLDQSRFQDQGLDLAIHDDGFQVGDLGNQALGLAVKRPAFLEVGPHPAFQRQALPT
jgi:hypothetical protein